ncbi:hypothetical protein ZYGR_0N06350 [Zygosaccharomyces rouxii]|uniref:ZYRO0D14894p n=2 Tax=Zygosaccharomyces rouxii TaxID=4956 RepID=C5DWH5_ZYGRC|nr:uncharacterized protein ZYRO0D14894g [Zygosaccharomyces rouxii]KAH9201055.1 U1 zinc finger-domain-containing protein [Zygosaccharomyces rouxii]GAV49228.1 hypothetical protein ZYGR_0N06350 [Zygosaccharomyces rouxii]CAR28144.1 ZYRO0D14894p [Zygosaccharomyces rouxii]
MARYYCEYCHSYLTHDTLSVRKSHLIGKNHLRITADYYRNKGKKQSRFFNRVSKKYGKRTEETKVSPPLNCSKRSEKRRNSKLSRLHAKELDQPIQTLDKLYEGSPGYSKVFIDSNRLDIGDLIRVSKLPQRANANAPNSSGSSASTVRARHETFTESLKHASSAPLEPPRVLSSWSNLPRTTFHDPSLPRIVINESRRRTR